MLPALTRGLLGLGGVFALAGWGFRFLIPVWAVWAGAGFFPWAIKGGGAGFSQGYSFGQRAEGTERSRSGGVKASGPARSQTGALRVRRALAVPVNFLNAFSRCSSSSRCALPERSSGTRPGVHRGGGRGEGWPVRNRGGRHLRGASAGPSQVLRWFAQAGDRGRRREPAWGKLRSGRVDWLGDRGSSGRNLREAKYQRAVEG